MTKNDERGLERAIQDVKLEVAERVMMQMVEETV